MVVKPMMLKMLKSKLEELKVQHVVGAAVVLHRCFQTCLYVGIPQETSQMTVAYDLPPEIVVELVQGVACTLGASRDPQMILNADKSLATHGGPWTCQTAICMLASSQGTFMLIHVRVT